MPESSPNTPAEDDDWADFDPRRFARTTIYAIEYGDAMSSVLEGRVIRLEEIVAARWPRSWLLRRRLARELRASAATWDPRYIPLSDFRARRHEAVSQQADDLYDRNPHGRRADWQGDAGRPDDQGDADPGEGFLP